MTILAFDGRMGAAGDMLLGALLAAGADRAALEPVEDALEVTYAVSEVTKNGIRATAVDVRLDGGRGRHGIDTHAHDHGHSHAQDDGAHDHEGDAHPAHGHDDPAEGAGPHRTYPEVLELVESMDLPPPVEADALAIFERLGGAEAAVHDTDLAATHFHEVGADDAVADVVGAALLVDDLGPDRVVTTPLSAGGGGVATSHGRYPVPTPAVVEIAERADWSIRGGPVEAELLTPTGAAILAHVAEGVDALPTMRVLGSGYGAGDRDFAEHPNVLRALLGESATAATDAAAGDEALRREEIRLLETNVDDIAPEVLGGLHETLAEAGARDVSIVPLSMKKSRPGHLVRVVTAPADADRVARRLARETGTLGVRDAGVAHRWVADREVRTASVEFDGERFAVDVKVASDASGAVYDVSAEYDDAAAVAAEVGRPVREVLRRAETRAWDELG